MASSYICQQRYKLRRCHHRRPVCKFRTGTLWHGYKFSESAVYSFDFMSIKTSCVGFSPLMNPIDPHSSPLNGHMLCPGWRTNSWSNVFLLAWVSRNLGTWWRHQMETFSALLAICAGNSLVSGEFPTQRPVTQSFDVVFDLRLNKRLSKHWQGWWYNRHRAHYDVNVMN